MKDPKFGGGFYKKKKKYPIDREDGENSFDFKQRLDRYYLQRGEVRRNTNENGEEEVTARKKEKRQQRNGKTLRLR